MPWKEEVIKTADVIFDEEIVYRTNDIDTAVREEVVVLVEVLPLPEEDQDDLLEFDTDQYFEGPRIKLGTQIPSSPMTPACVLEDIGHLPSPESLTLDEESPKANDEPSEGHETNDIEDNFEPSGAKVEARATSPNGSDDDENRPEITFPSDPRLPLDIASNSTLTGLLTPLGLTPSVSSGPSRGRGSRAYQGIDSSNIQASRTRRRHPPD